MKKTLIICLLFCLFEINLSYSVTRIDGPSDPELAKKQFFENSKLDIIEGLWYDGDEGAIYAIVKTSSNVYNIWTILTLVNQTTPLLTLHK